MKREPYYIGLEVGPTYAAYAVTNESYNLERFRGKDMWGIYKFDEAESSQDRKNARSARKNIKKEKERIGLIRSYFHDEIEKADVNFFARLDNSTFHAEDKDKILSGDRNVLFNDENYKDADYNEQFPTIYHLRSFLAKHNELVDIRLVYLAVANIMKHRGNFYSKNLEDTDSAIKDIYAGICEKASQADIQLYPEADTDKIMDYMLNTALTNKVKATLVSQEVKALTKSETALIKLMCGLKVKITDIFPGLLETLPEEDKKTSMSFSDNDYLDRTEEIENLTGEDNYELISAVKELYDAVIIQNIMQGHRFISDAKIASYEKHMADLKLLKSTMKRYLSKQEYSRFFNIEEPGTYAAYVKSGMSNGVKTRRNSEKGRTLDDLYGSIKKLLLKADEDDEDAEYILDEIGKRTFLPKQRTSDNRLIPNQLYAAELKAILDNAAEHYGFLNEKDDSGLTVSERIMKFFTFTMPYFIGPTSEYNTRGWVVRKEAGKVMPWNLEEKIDVKESAKSFIESMIGKCTYLSGERVLPKSSLLYERFMVLNEMNCIRVDGEKIPVEIKQEIVNGKLALGKKLTRKQILSFLVKKGLATSDSLITGMDEKLNNTMTSHKIFTDIFGTLDSETQAAAEDIILWSAIYGDSKEYVKQQIENKYPGLLDEDRMKKALSIKSNDWGKLSKEFLTMTGTNKETGERISIIDAMWQMNLSLNELINDNRYDFMSLIKEKTIKAEKNIFTFEYDDLNELYATASQKRSIWAAVKIVREVEKIKGYAPESVFLNTIKNRPKDVKKDARKTRLIELYKNLKGVSKEWKDSMISHISECDSDGSLKSKKVYLYFLQLGKDMYTWKDIDFKEVIATGSDVYNIDHIYPKHYVKDDSMDNIVLTNAGFNKEEKKDIYPVPDSIYQTMHENWLYLRQNGFMSAEKLARLSDRNPMSDEKRAAFIGKLYTQVSSSTKMMADIFKNILSKDTKVIYTKSSEVSDFRRQYGFPKMTMLNEHYLAKDAYLNIVVGNVWYTKFTASPMWYIEKEYRTGKSEYNLNRMYDFNIIRDERIAWIAESKKKNIPGTIAVIKKVMSRNTPVTVTRITEGHGALTNATISKAAKSKPGVYLPLKSDERYKDVTKYGGKTSIKTAYNFLVEHTDKHGSRIRTLYSLPLYLANNVKNKEDIEKYCRETLGLKEPDVRINKIMLNSELEIDGYRYLLGGKTGLQYGLKNNTPMVFDVEWQGYISKIEKYIDFKTVDKDITSEKNIELYDEILGKHKNSIFSRKRNPLYNLLESCRDNFVGLSLEEQMQALYQVLFLTRMGTNVSNLSVIGAGANVGLMHLNATISKASSVKLIEISITGMYTKETDMLNC